MVRFEKILLFFASLLLVVGSFTIRSVGSFQPLRARRLGLPVLRSNKPVENKADFTFIRAERDDMKQIAGMLSEAFDNKPNPLVRWYSVWNYEEQLKERLVRLVEMGKDHSMLIASKPDMTPPTLSNMDKVEMPHHMCGFIELGLLPLPENRVPTASNEEDDDEELTSIFESTDRLPTIGNLVVDEMWRKRGVGTALLGEAVRTAREWGYPIVICAVNPHNTPAVKLYEKNGFRCAFMAKTTVQINVIQSQQDLKIMIKKVPPL